MGTLSSLGQGKPVWDRSKASRGVGGGRVGGMYFVIPSKVAPTLMR
jgi:hypothetical protein